ncbi:MAG: hypothetical protein GY854_07445 [Deltaproteobacteria bacterium]|nr:hypothetical protein [Deltaproteobacteria bacterium]
MYRILCLVIGLLIASSCAIDDDDRCPDGFVFLPEFKACEKVEDDGDSDVDTSSSPPSTTDAGADGTDGGEDGGGDEEKESGLGVECMKLEDCEEYLSDYCTYNDLLKTGYCTTQDCPASGDCESGYLCCDCTGSSLLPKEKACLTEADAKLAGDYAGCSCS